MLTPKEISSIVLVNVKYLNDRKAFSEDYWRGWKCEIYRVDSFAYWFNLFIGLGGILDSKSIPIGFPNIGQSDPEVPEVSFIPAAFSIASL